MPIDAQATDSLNTPPSDQGGADGSGQDLSTFDSMSPETASFPGGEIPSASATDPMEGMKLPQVPGYEILGVLGRGGMGVVYHARQTQLKREVALKMIRAGDHVGDSALARFQTEAEAIASLHHPNIVQLFDHGQHDGMPYFTLEYVSGGSLADEIRDAAVPPREAAHLVRQLAEGMSYAHDKGILHRDLKPGNVLLARTDRQAAKDSSSPGNFHPVLADLRAKITDFGLAKKLDAAAEMTATGAVMGTPGYMAPEQAAGKKVGPGADIYALGAILYRLLTGRPPFQAASVEDFIFQVLNADPAPPSKLIPKVPRDLETICLKCLAKEPERRYPRSQALADDLRLYQAGEPILARPLGSLARLWRWCKRKPARAAAAVAGLIALVTVIVAFFLIRASRDDAVLSASLEAKARQDAEERRKKAEILTVQLKFEQAYQLTDDKRALSIFTAVSLLREAIALKDQALQESLRLHLGGWRQELHPLQHIFSHQDDVQAVAFSPDGKTAVTASGDKTARLWETSTGKPIGPPLQHEHGVLATTFSPDGTMVLTGSKDKTARLWGTATGQPIGPPVQHQDSVGVVAFSPDGKTMLTGSSDATARLWHTATRQPLGPPLQHKNTIFALAFSPDGKNVLTGSADKTAQLWDAASGKPVGPPLQHQHYVTLVAFSQDGKTMLTGSEDRTARLWATANSQPIGLPLEHQQPPRAVAFLLDGEFVLTGGGHGRTTNLWETVTGKPLVRTVPSHEILAATFSPDGGMMLTGGSDDLAARLWSTGSGRPLGPPLQHLHLVVAVAFSPDGKYALTGSRDLTARLWQISGGSIGNPLVHPDVGVEAVAFSPDGKTILTGSHDKTAQLWDTTTKKPIGPPLRHQDSVIAVAFSPDGRTVLTGSVDKTARLWDTATGKPLGPPLEHEDEVLAATFSPNGKMVLTGSKDKTARLWEADTGKAIGLPLEHQGFVHAVSFSPDGKIILTGSENLTAQFWETATGQRRGPPMNHRASVQSVGFSPDGKTVLTGSYDNTAQLWDTATGQRLGPPLQHTEPVWTAVFSPDGKTILTGTDSQIRFWEAATGKALGLRHSSRAEAAAFSPDGQTVLTAAKIDRPAQLWLVPRPLQGDPDRLFLWAQVVTGMKLDEFGGTRALGASEWEQLRQRLQELGGLQD